MRSVDECSIEGEGDSRQTSRRISELCELFEGGEGGREEQTAKSSVHEVGTRGGVGGKSVDIIHGGGQQNQGKKNNFTFIEHSAHELNSRSSGDKENWRFGL